MTGFGCAEREHGRGVIRIEMRSYNHRFLDLRLRVARPLQPMEPRVYAWAKNRLVRGRVELNVHWEALAGTGEPLRLNEDALTFYLHLGRRLREEFGVEGTLDVNTMVRLKDLVVSQEESPDLEKDWSVLHETLEDAAAQMEQMQDREGRVLQEDLLGRVVRLMEQCGRIEAMSGDVSDRFRARLEEKVSRLADGSNVDPQRIAQEIVLYADKTDITEEMVRLSSHLNSCHEALKDGSMTGKRLEFLAQEIHREVNTIGSKTPSAEVTYLVVDMKSELEKVREQSQNLQ
jgi:uncharacterized protein (TIGR00255 family)